MSYPKRGDRRQLYVTIPLDLHEWLQRRARPNGPDSYCPEHKSKNSTVVHALELLRMLDEGIVTTASEQLLSDALDQLDLRTPRTNVWKA